MAITQLPGFQNPVHQAQRTFRALLDALSRPGVIYPIDVKIKTPPQINSAYGAACLTLLDLETQVWLQPGMNEEVRNWLLFHTNCSFVVEPSMADFALIYDVAAMPELSCFKWGTPEVPENSTTLLIPVESWEQGQPVELIGAGILGKRQISPKLAYEHFWNCWIANQQTYPSGVDMFFFTQNAVMGLPRTVKVKDIP